MNILIIEDDEILNAGIKATLENKETIIHQCYCLEEGKEWLQIETPDLILLDVNLQDGTGFHFCKEIRKKLDVPVIFLTARDMETDIVKGLEYGGDDYIIKPFSLRVLRARIQAVMRRKGKLLEQQYKIDHMTFDFNHMIFIRGGEKVNLSKTEQKLLKILLANQGNILSKEQLMDKIWTEEAQYVDENALTVTVKRLRDKLEKEPSTPRYIKNIYGIGYTWTQE